MSIAKRERELTEDPWTLPSYCVLIHEAGHVVVARHLDVPVVYATVRGGDPHVRTGQTGGQLLELMQVDLAGGLAEVGVFGGVDDWAISTDEANAVRRALQLTGCMESARRLVERQRAKAADLVRANQIPIMRVAKALREREHLDQNEIDALMKEPA